MTISAFRVTRYFDRLNPYWNDLDRKQNVLFLTMIQMQLNDLLRVRGYVSLNHALGLLGFERIAAGNMIGWVRYPEPGEGDGYIHFGVWDEGMARGKDWLSGELVSLPIRFNVDSSETPFHHRVEKLRKEGKI